MGTTIYHKATGEARECEHVDAREILEASPEIYSAEPVEAAPEPAAKPKRGRAEPAPEPAVEAAAEPEAPAE